MSRKACLLACAILSVASPAFGVNLASGVLQAAPGSTLTCTVTNTGSKPVKATAVLRSFASGSSIATIDTCTGKPIAAGGSCVLDSGGFDSGSIG
ncbi:MAG TPA: hypothetical protein VIS07_17570 [Candidatus Binatia bacterium]